MFLDHILAIAGLSLDTTQNLYLCVRPGVVIQGHISFDANISLFTPESDLVTRRGWIWHFHIDLVFTIASLSLSPRQSRAGGNTRVNIINWPLLPPHSDCSHAHTNKSYDVPENRGDLVQDTSSFAVLTSISLWDLDIEQSFNELQKLKSLHTYWMFDSILKCSNNFRLVGGDGM